MSLHNRNLEDATLAVLLPALSQCTAMTRLDLGGNPRLTVASVDALAWALLQPTLPRLLDLCLAGNKGFKTGGLCRLAVSLASNTSLEVLDISDTNANQRGLEAIFQALTVCFRFIIACVVKVYS